MKKNKIFYESINNLYQFKSNKNRNFKYLHNKK